MEPTEDQKRAWGRALRDARKAAGLSGRDLAARLGTSHQRIYQWESGSTAPVDREVLDRLEEVLGTGGRLTVLLVGDPDLEPRLAALEATLRTQGETLARLERLLSGEEP